MGIINNFSFQIFSCWIFYLIEIKNGWLADNKKFFMTETASSLSFLKICQRYVGCNFAGLWRLIIKIVLGFELQIFVVKVAHNPEYPWRMHEEQTLNVNTIAPIVIVFKNVPNNRFVVAELRVKIVFNTGLDFSNEQTLAFFYKGKQLLILKELQRCYFLIIWVASSFLKCFMV